MDAVLALLCSYHVNASKDPELDGEKVVGVFRGRDEVKSQVVRDHKTLKCRHAKIVLKFKFACFLCENSIAHRKLTLNRCCFLRKSVMRKRSSCILTPFQL